jgi:hypothetical protein
MSTAMPLGGGAARRRVLASQRVVVDPGGLLALGGPPLGGKSLLAARLAECLPRATRLEAIDDLSRSAPYWQPSGRNGRTIRNPAAAMLAEAGRIWRERPPHRAPVIVLVARFATALERRRARVAARRNGMRFLFVECRSRDDRALRRIPMSFLPPAELRERLRRYDAALRAYEAVGNAEALLLPALRLARVQSQIDEKVERVLARWRFA